MKNKGKDVLRAQMNELLIDRVDAVASGEEVARYLFIEPQQSGTQPVVILIAPAARWGEIKSAIEDVVGNWQEEYVN